MTTLTKYGIATKIAFVLVAHGKKTSDSLVVKGSDKALVAEFGDIFKGRTVVIDGLNNIIRSFKTMRTGTRATSASIINGVIDNNFTCKGETGLCAMLMYKQRQATYALLNAHYEAKKG